MLRHVPAAPPSPGSVPVFVALLRPVREWAFALVLGLLYFVLSALSVELTRFDGGAAFVWLATAPLLAYLLSRRPERWLPPILCCGIGSWIASTIFGLGLVPGGLISIAVIAEAVIPAALLRRLRPNVSAFDGLASVTTFVLVAGALAPFACGVAAGLVIAHWSHRDPLSVWGAWWSAHALGTITFAPLLLLALRGDVWLELRRMRGARIAEAAALLTVVALVTTAVFVQQTMPLLFLPLLPLLVVTFRLGRPGAAAAVVLFACLGGLLTARGLGPIGLMRGSIGSRAEFFQFYIATAVLMVLAAAAELQRRERLFLKLQESEARYRLLADKAGDSVIQTSPDGEVRFASPAILGLTGFPPEQIIGRNSRDFVIAEDLDRFQAARAQALADPDTTITVEYRAGTRERGIEWRETQMRSYVDERGVPAGVVIVVRDISRRKRAEADLELAAMTDALTGLPNRRSFFERLDQLVADASGEPSSMALFDIDFFKRINDQYGHSTGDTVLRAVSAAARSAVRAPDLLARIGGEEFALLLVGVDQDRAHATCERIRLAIAACRVPAADGRAISVTASFGLSAIDGGRTAAAIFDAADQGLYAAKAAGRDCIRIAA